MKLFFKFDSDFYPRFTEDLPEQKKLVQEEGWTILLRLFFPVVLEAF